MTDYESLVKNLKAKDILDTWQEITSLQDISGLSTVNSSQETIDKDVFDGHDEEQIRLMDELCIVLDYDDKPLGAGTKKLCHLMENINRGLLHRAFSVFLFNEENKLLLQQRADEKITFPKMWTNTCCSHPLAIKSELGRDVYELESAISGVKHAAQRKLFHELGIPNGQVKIEDFHFLTRIHYKSSSGDETSKWGEHEIDYILILKGKNFTIDANLNEVKDYKYVTQDELKAMFEDTDLVFTPWFKLICQTFLFKWWDNLDNLKQFEDDKVHRLL